MQHAGWKRIAAALLGTTCLLGETPPPDASPSSPRTVSSGIELSTIGVPGGWMGQNSDRLADAIQLKGAEASECGGDSNCLRITYCSKWGWAGIYWWPTACEKQHDRWQAVKSGTCAIDLRKGSDSRPIDRLIFKARGVKGREKVTFGVGGDDLLPEKMQITVSLGQTWQEYQIGLTDRDLKKVTGLFSWFASNLDNPSGFTIYLKDVRFTAAP